MKSTSLVADLGERVLVEARIFTVTTGCAQNTTNNPAACSLMLTGVVRGGWVMRRRRRAR